MRRSTSGRRDGWGIRGRRPLVLAAILGLGLVAAAPGGLRSQAPPAGDARERAYRSNNSGVAYLEQFNYTEAEQAFRRALESQPDLALARLNLALALLYAGRPSEALVDAREAARLMPKTPQAHFVHGLAARADDKVDEAAAAFERTMKLDPADAGTKIHLGQIHLQGRRYPEALRVFQEALASEPYNVTAAYNVALALMRSGQAEAGRAAMQRFEVLRDSPYGVTYAQTYLAQGRYGEALSSTGAEPDLVDAETPAVTFADASGDVLPQGAPGTGMGGAAMLFDADVDGDLDLLEVGATGGRFLRNTGKTFADETARAGVAIPREGGWLGAVAGDYDNDMRPDVLVIGRGRLLLLRQKEDGGFEPAPSTGTLPKPAEGISTAAFADADHDGDLDIVLAGSGLQLFQNNGTGTFTDISASAGLTGAADALAVVPTDYDNRRDVDLVLAARSRPRLYRNLRDGSFRDTAQDAGLPGADAYSSAVAAGDLNKDGYPDFFFGRSSAPGLLAMSEAQGRFRTVGAPAETAAAAAAQFFDYDNDGLLDLLAWTASGPRLLRALGGGGWADVTARARFPSAPGAPESLAVGDLDGDGDRDLIARVAGELRVWRNDGGTANRAVSVRLAARVSNRSGYGSKIEMRAGSLRQQLELSSAWPAAAPADLVFGLGRRAGADVIRVLWPSGILQAEIVGESAAAAGGPAPTVITELDRKPSSCPYLFTWNGERFEFITDFMGGGEMGAWLAPSVWNGPDPDEYVRIPAERLQPRGGRYELRMTNELEEALFFDRVQLLAIDHAEDQEVYPNEGLRSAPRPAFRAVTTRGARLPAAVRNGHGRDLLPQVAELDRRYVDDFGLLPIRGYAEPHEIVIDLGSSSDRAILLLTGWTDYAFSSDNVAASQGGTSMLPPSLQVRDAQGRWTTVLDEIGFPVGRPQTVVVDLAGRFLSASREVRIVTNMRIYWDRILVAEPGREPAGLARLDPIAADLRERGFSREVSPDGREPFAYDYERVTMSSPWKTLVGRYTRLGDVRRLLLTADDLFVVSKPGDEVALSFPALPPPPRGLVRTFLFYAHGYSKEMNPRSAVPDTVAPLPFRAMSGYPYPPGEHYPRTAAHREYQQEYNTRVVTRPWPSIDAAAASALPSGGSDAVTR